MWNSAFISLSFFGYLRGEVGGQPEILRDVVQLPLVLGEIVGPELALPGARVHHGRHPAVVVDAAVAGGLVVLRDVAILGVGVVEGIAAC